MNEAHKNGVKRLWQSLHGWVQFIVTAGVAITMLWAFHQWSVTLGEERGARSVIQRNIPERVDSLEAIVYAPGRLAERVTAVEAGLDDLREEAARIRELQADLRQLDAKVERVVCLAEVQAEIRDPLDCR